MDILEKAKRMRQLGDEYEELLNDVINALFKVVPNCLALNMEDSLMPVYSVSALSTKGLLAFPYNCGGKPGYIVLTEDGKLMFEDLEGNVSELGTLTGGRGQ